MMITVTMTVDANGAGTGSVTASGFSCSGALTTCNGSFAGGTGVTFRGLGVEHLPTTIVKTWIG
jgi:hypothetical protein